jgi:hypothetical protein
MRAGAAKPCSAPSSLGWLCDVSIATPEPDKSPWGLAFPTDKPVRLKLRRVTSFCTHSIATFAKTSLAPGCEVVSDGLRCFSGVTEAGCSHRVIITGSGPISARTPAFKWVNTALGNIKASITGTYRAISTKHVPRYLAEFEYRFNRRYDLAAMVPRLAQTGVQTPPMPYRLLKLAEVYAQSGTVLTAGPITRDAAAPAPPCHHPRRGSTERRLCRNRILRAEPSRSYQRGPAPARA